ncbi:hypothetical protein AVW16_03475 [Crenobacter luteus]|uniref:Pilus assembly protein PilE n=2 Tax=Crenobacter luteus TaxID=1452487 RepID=A0A165ELA7_9NEIS|nr:hypothetical protein AVW16_03475 [Crenobacter luteus]
MIVVAVIGILAAISYPSYRQYVARSRVAEARAEMFALAQQLEQRYSSSGGFADVRCEASATGGCALPASGTAYFRVGYIASGARYWVRASAVSGYLKLAADEATPCAFLELTQSGERRAGAAGNFTAGSASGGVSGAAYAGDEAARCWER